MNRYTWRTGIREGVMIIVALVFLFPIYILVNLSVRPVTDLTSPILPTQNPTLENFATAWTASGLGSAMINSVVVTAVSVILLIVLSSLAAFAITRSTARWSSLAFYGFMIGLLVPFQLGLVPLYQAFVKTGLVGSFIPLIIIDVGLRLPFTIFLYAQFLRQIPDDYEEAAALDGCSPVRAFAQVVFPLLRPVTGTAIVLNGLFIWNDFLSPLLYLSGSSNKTVPIAVYSFVSEYNTEWPLVFAALIIGALPVLLVFVFVQRTLIQGLASGVKG